MLAFGKKPQRFFPTATIKCAHFHGFEVAKPIPDHKVFQGDVFEQVDQAVDFVLSKISVSVGIRMESNQAPIEYEIPIPAIREAIVNAVVHRDYHSLASVQVMLFKDRLEVSNPGRLPQQLTLAKLRVRHASYPHNPLLAECMYQAGYIERFGTGTLEIIRLLEEARLEQPDFNTDEGFKVVLWRPIVPTELVPDKYLTSTDHINDHDTDYVSDHVTDYVPSKYLLNTDHIDEPIKRLISMLSKPKSRPELMAMLDLSHNTNFRKNYLNPSIAAGYIEMTQPDKPKSIKQRYRLTPKGLALKKTLEHKQ